MNALILSALKALLKHFAGPAFAGKIQRESKGVAKHLDGAHKSFPAQPTDADRAVFCHEAIYWLLKAAGVPGEAAGLARHAIQAPVTAVASPKLSAGLTTQQAAAVVAEQMLAVAESLIP